MYVLRYGNEAPRLRQLIESRKHCLEFKKKKVVPIEKIQQNLSAVKMSWEYRKFIIGNLYLSEILNFN